MPKVPDYNNKPLKPTFRVNASDKATMKQKHYIMTLCERRKLPVPDLKTLTKLEAQTMLQNMTTENN
jgi:hypothetical protein